MGERPLVSPRLAYACLLCVAALGMSAAPGLAAPGNDATIVASSTFEVADGSTGSGVATCPAGARVVGGGVGMIGPAVDKFKGQNEVEVSGPLDETGSTVNTDTGD